MGQSLVAQNQMRPGHRMVLRILYSRFFLDHEWKVTPQHQHVDNGISFHPTFIHNLDFSFNLQLLLRCYFLPSQENFWFFLFESSKSPRLDVAFSIAPDLLYLPCQSLFAILKGSVQHYF